MSTRVEHRQNGKNDWRTPKSVYDPLKEEFNLQLDVAADSSNHLTGTWLGPGSDLNENGLEAGWGQMRCWCNPPYSDWQKWVEKAYLESQRGATVVMLLPARTDTKAFHQWILPFAEIRFIKGRITFVGAENPAPFPSMIVVFRPPQEDFQDENRHWWRGHRHQYSIFS